jgi:hypothetical protein
VPTPPADASIDALFADARGAVIDAGPGFPGGTLLRLEGDDLPRLREALRITPPTEHFRCMCRGDLVITLRGRWRAKGAISFHHGVSVRLDGWDSDAPLVDGAALLRLLAERGVAGPLEAFERARVEGRARASARVAWVAAAPEAIRASLGELEHGPLGMPRRLEAAEIDATLARVRGDREGCDDAALARALITWLAAGRGPFSGYASYEEVPIRLLEALPIGAVVEVALDPALDDAAVAACARFFADHQIVTFRKGALAAVPDAFFARATPLLALEDDRARLAHAARVAEGARRPRSAPYPIDGGLEVLGQSTDGPLSGLGVDGDALVSADVRTLVRFEPDSIAAVPIADARDAFLSLSPTPPVAWAVGRRGEIATPHGVVATGENCPVEIAAGAGGIAWIAKHRNDERVLRAVVSGDPTVRTLATDSLLWCLAVDGDYAFFVEAGWRGGGTLCKAPLAGGAIARVASIPALGPSMAAPRYVIEGGEALVALGDHVSAIDARGRARRLIEAGAPIQAIAADATHVALVLGLDGDRDSPWSLAVAPRGGGKARAIASFARAPYHRHPLVLARGRACTIADDRIIAARLSP